MGDGYDSVVDGLSRVKCPVLVGVPRSICVHIEPHPYCPQVLGVTFDVLFPVDQQRHLAELLKQSGEAGEGVGLGVGLGMELEIMASQQ